MNDEENLQPAMRQQAFELLQHLSPADREALMIKCWMSHDARWFMAVAREFGMEVTNRINKEAICETGKVEALRLARALKLWPVKTVDDYLLVQEAIIGFFGPDLLDYDLRKVADDEYEIQVRRCFAYDNIARVGMENEFECGIFERSRGWCEALDIECEVTPPLGKCVKAHGQECTHTFKYRAGSGAG
jgi:hypothetical protein